MVALAVTTGMAPGIVGLFFESGWMGKVVMSILLIFSVVSWAVILLKYQFLRRAEKESRSFLASFRKTKNIDELLTEADAKKFSPLATLFIEGHKDIDIAVFSKIIP